MTLQKRIKKRRLQQNFSLLEVAQQLGISEATMQRYESGTIKNMKHETIVSLSQILNCSPGYLMGWESEHELETKIKISDNLKKLMKKSSLTRQQLSEKSKIDENILYDYIHLKKLISIEDTQKLSTIFNVTKSEIDPNFDKSQNIIFDHNNNFTEDEIAEINRYAKYILSKRNNGDKL